jgi:hypothetical protein
MNQLSRYPGFVYTGHVWSITLLSGKLTFLVKLDECQEPLRVIATAKITLDGQEVPLQELIGHHLTAQLTAKLTDDATHYGGISLAEFQLQTP